MKKPKVILTRTENNPHKLSEKYPQIEWIEFPLIKFEYQELSQEVINEIQDNCDWLVFTSQNGVKSFFEQIENIPDKLIACVGPKTAGLVENFGYGVNFIPSIFTSITLAKEMPITHSESICYVGGNLSSQETLDVLEQRSKHFMQIVVYHTTSQMHELFQWQDLLGIEPDFISFASPSAVASFSSQLKKFEIPFPERIQYAAIGTTTSAAIKDDLGMTPIIGEKHTFASMIEKIVETIAHD